MTSARRPRIFVTQPVAKSAVARLRQVATVTINPDASRIIGRRALIAAVRRCDILFCLLHDQIDAGVIAANSDLRFISAQSITPSNIDVEAATARGIPVTVVPAHHRSNRRFGFRLDACGCAANCRRRPPGAS
jgi:phosphoglycerate dehydrogenase-like enzyme